MITWVNRAKSWAVLLLSLLIQLPGGPAYAGESKPAWQAEWEKTLQAAHQEGEVVLYGSQENSLLFQEFQKKYPQIKVTHVPGHGGPTSQRILNERRAGKYVGDFYSSGAWTGYNVLYKGKVLDPVKPILILPEVLDESKWWKGKHKYADEKGEYPVFNFIKEVTAKRR